MTDTTEKATSLPQLWLRVEALSHRYPGQQNGTAALRDISFRIESQRRFAFLGPNGSGKTTLFKILSTLLSASSGRVKMLGFDLEKDRESLQKKIGVVFQKPSLDPQLTCEENLRHHGQLFGMAGQELEVAIKACLRQVKLLERSTQQVKILSGGLQRRLEIAKALLPKPQLLILDEPTVGLDPGLRRDLWSHLNKLCEEEGVAILYTTHLTEEADLADQVAILDQGQLIASGTPAELKARIGGDILRIKTEDPSGLCSKMQEKFGGNPKIVGAMVHLERQAAHAFLPELVEAFPGEILEASFSHPTLEDVFIHETGRRFTWEKAST